ncbi:hypothetical protein RQP46_000053 [Phenoliferia psychrophenolica]
MSPLKFQYLVKVLGDSQTEEYTFNHEGPREAVVNQTAAGKLLAELVYAHMADVDRKHVRACAECGKPASRLTHNPASYLTKTPPIVVDMCFPLCSLGGPCEAANNELFRSVAAEHGAASSELQPRTFSDQSRKEFTDSVVQAALKNPTLR